MSEEQRTLAGYKSPVHKQDDFADANAGKPLLNDSDEYVFYLKEIPRVKKMSVDKEDKQTGDKKKVLVDKAICEFVEESTKNIVLSFLKVESLNFSDDGKFESAVVTFFKKIKRPLPTDQDVNDWTEHFVTGMRFRSRVVVKTKLDKDNNPITTYYLDIPTCRPILQSDKHPEAVAASTPLQSTANASDLANAMIIVHGCDNVSDATKRLSNAKVAEDVMSAFLTANGEGKIKYPC